MASSLQAQLALLRKRIQSVEARSAAAAPASAGLDCLRGEVVETAAGSHLEVVRRYPLEHRHGQMYVERLAELGARRWVYLDTETTGLAGGAGTLAFLIGAAEVTADGFVLRQWFLRNHGDEASALLSLAQYLEQFETLVTYNGRTYDQPLLESRYILSRQRPPFGRLEHLDLLYGARRLWKLRFESCRLVELERQILGYERTGDVPGELIPQLYFEFLRTGRAARLQPVLEHNAHDILSLAFLAAIIPAAFDDPLATSLRHGAELSGLARWLAAEGRHEEACELYRRAVEAAHQDEVLFRSLYEWGVLEKKRKRTSEAVAVFSDLAASPNPYRAEAYIELAKYYEHTERNLFMAQECARAAWEIEPSPAVRHRLNRLERKLSPRLFR